MKYQKWILVLVTKYVLIQRECTNLLLEDTESSHWMRFKV